MQSNNARKKYIEKKNLLEYYYIKQKRKTQIYRIAFCFQYIFVHTTIDIIMIKNQLK